MRDYKIFHDQSAVNKVFSTVDTGPHSNETNNYTVTSKIHQLKYHSFHEVAFPRLSMGYTFSPHPIPRRLRPSHPTASHETSMTLYHVVCVCMVCTALATAKFLCARSRDSFAGVCAWDALSFLIY